MAGDSGDGRAAGGRGEGVAGGSPGGRRMLVRLGCWRVAGAERDLGPSGRRHGALLRSETEGKQAGRHAVRQTRNPQTKPELFSLLRAKKPRSAWGADWLAGLV